MVIAMGHRLRLWIRLAVIAIAASTLWARTLTAQQALTVNRALFAAVRETADGSEAAARARAILVEMGKPLGMSDATIEEAVQKVTSA